jgi:hypothetical protein
VASGDQGIGLRLGDSGKVGGRNAGARSSRAPFYFFFFGRFRRPAPNQVLAHDMELRPYSDIGRLERGKFVLAFFGFFFFAGESGFQESSGQVLATDAEGNGQAQHYCSHDDGKGQKHGGVG